MTSITSKELEQIANAAARQEMGRFAWPTLILGVAVYGGLIGGVYAGVTELVAQWVAFLIVSYAIFGSYTLMHEAVHGNISGRNAGLQWLNVLVGLLAGMIILMPYTAHRLEHYAHHQNTNDPENDPDYGFSSGHPLSILYKGLTAIPKQWTFYLSYGWKRDNWGYRLLFLTEIAAAIALRVVPVALGYGQEVLLYGVLAWFAGLYVLVLLFAWIVHNPHDKIGRYIDTTTFTFPAWMDGAITWVWLFQNYHSIHHLFPRVPFYAYKRVFLEIRPVMEKMDAPIHDIWGGVGGQAVN